MLHANNSILNNRSSKASRGRKRCSNRNHRESLPAARLDMLRKRRLVVRVVDRNKGKTSWTWSEESQVMGHNMQWYLNESAVPVARSSRQYNELL